MSIKKEFVIDSRDRIAGGDIENFSITVPEQLRVERIKLTSISVPATYYNVTDLNRNLDINASSISIAAGQYLIDELITAIEAELPGYTLTFSTLTDRLTISAADPFSILFSTGAHATTNLRHLMGFSDVDVVGLNTYTGDLSINLGGDPYILVKSDSICQVKNGVIHSDDPIDEGIIGVIQCDSGCHGSTIFQKKLIYNPECIIRDGYATTIFLQLCFYGDIQLDLNGINWACTINLYCSADY